MAIKDRRITCAACGERETVIRGERGLVSAYCDVCRAERKRDQARLRGFRWGLLRSVKDLRKGPCQSATTGPRGRFCSVRTVERGSCDRLIRWPFGKNTPSQQAPTEPI